MMNNQNRSQAFHRPVGPFPDSPSQERRYVIVDEFRKSRLPRHQPQPPVFPSHSSQVPGSQAQPPLFQESQSNQLPEFQAQPPVDPEFQSGPENVSGFQPAPENGPGFQSQPPMYPEFQPGSGNGPGFHSEPPMYPEFQPQPDNGPPGFQSQPPVYPESQHPPDIVPEFQFQPGMSRSPLQSDMDFSDEELPEMLSDHEDDERRPSERIREEADEWRRLERIREEGDLLGRIRSDLRSMRAQQDDFRRQRLKEERLRMERIRKENAHLDRIRHLRRMEEERMKALRVKVEEIERKKEEVEREKEEMRYQEDSVVYSNSDYDDVVHLFDCSICWETMNSPIFQCRENHMVCESCRNSLPLPRRCPQCRQQLGDQRARFAESLIDRIVYPCMNKFHGCPKLLKPSERADHLNSCKFAQFGCPYMRLQCPWVGQASDLFDHLKDGHEVSTSRPDLFSYENYCFIRGAVLRDGDTRSMLISNQGRQFVLQWAVRGAKVGVCVRHLGPGPAGRFELRAELKGGGAVTESGQVLSIRADFPEDQWFAVHVSKFENQNVPDVFLKLSPE
eukprot:862285_1